MNCPKGKAWDSVKKKCVTVGPGQSIANPLSLLGVGEKEYSLKGGVNWFGEDSPSNKGMKRALAKTAASKLSSKIKNKKKRKN